MKAPIKFTPDKATTMAVSDLIEALKDTDPDKPLYVYDLHSGERMPVAKIDTSITEYVDINISTWHGIDTNPQDIPDDCRMCGTCWFCQPGTPWKGWCSRMSITTKYEDKCDKYKPATLRHVDRLISISEWPERNGYVKNDDKDE